MSTPQQVTDPVLGTLRKLRDLPNHWRGRVTIADLEVTVNLYLPQDFDVNDAIAAARNGYSFAQENEMLLRRTITNALLTDYNRQRWADEPHATEDEFISGLTLSSIAVSENMNELEISFGYESALHSEHQPNVHWFPKSNALEVVIE